MEHVADVTHDGRYCAAKLESVVGQARRCIIHALAVVCLHACVAKPIQDNETLCVGLEIALSSYLVLINHIPRLGPSQRPTTLPRTTTSQIVQSDQL